MAKVVKDHDLKNHFVLPIRAQAAQAENVSVHKPEQVGLGVRFADIDVALVSKGRHENISTKVLAQARKETSTAKEVRRETLLLILPLGSYMPQEVDDDPSVEAALAAEVVVLAADHV